MLTEGELARWRRDGVLLVPDAVGPDERRGLPEWAETLKAWVPRYGDPHGLVHQRASLGVVSTENVVDQHEALAALAQRGPLMEIATVLLGEPVVLHSDLIRFGAGQASIAPLAMQLRSRAKYIDRHLGCIVAIDAVNEGDIEVALGWHRRRLAADRHGNIDPKLSATLPWTSVVLQVGESLWLHSGAPHRSGDQRAGRTLELTYSARVQGDLRAAHYVLRRRQVLGLEESNSTNSRAGYGTTKKGM